MFLPPIYNKFNLVFLQKFRIPHTGHPVPRRQKNLRPKHRGEGILRGTTLIIPLGRHLSHPVTGMNRPAPCGTLQSGCLAAWAEGSHHLPLAESRFRKAGFFTAFCFMDSDIISLLRDLSRSILLFFVLRRGLFRLLAVFFFFSLPCPDTLPAADAGCAVIFPVVQDPANHRRNCQNRDQKQPAIPRHSTFSLCLMLKVYHRMGGSVSGISNSLSPSRGSSSSGGPGRSGRGNSWGSITVPSGRGRLR